MMTPRMDLDRLDRAVKTLWGPNAHYGYQMCPPVKKPWHAGPPRHNEAVKATTYDALLAMIERRLAQRGTVDLSAFRTEGP